MKRALFAIASAGIVATAVGVEAVNVTPDAQAILLPPSPPAEKASACQDQAEQASTSDGSFDEGQCPSHSPRCGHQYDRGC
jgi:hypothetical protein